MSYQMSDLLQLMVSEGGADLHIRVNIPPVIRIHGALDQKVHDLGGPAAAFELDHVRTGLHQHRGAAQGLLA